MSCPRCLNALIEHGREECFCVICGYRPRVRRVQPAPDADDLPRPYSAKTGHTSYGNHEHKNRVPQMPSADDMRAAMQRAVA